MRCAQMQMCNGPGHFKIPVDGTWLFPSLLPVPLELEEDTTYESGKHQGSSG